MLVDTLTNCDDGNLVNGDGCSSSCTVENGWVCSGGTPNAPDVCKNVCGDGILIPGLEECDDRNIRNGDG